MSQIKVLVVEDELYSRAKIVHFLSLAQQVSEVREAENGAEGLQVLQTWCPDLLIADVYMPHLDGFEMISRLPKDHRPMIIFTTAYKDYALKAFEVNAIDYLLKPFSLNRFMTSFSRVISHLSLKRKLEMEEAIEEDDALEDEPNTYLSHIRVEGMGRMQVIIPLRKVKMIRAAGNYSEFFTDDTSYLRRGSLKELMTRLDPQVFIRINRSEVVRIEEIAEINPKAHGDAELLMKHGERLKWSRRYRAENGGQFEI
jgi:two-component system LytT family response regulator